MDWASCISTNWKYTIQNESIFKEINSTQIKSNHVLIEILVVGSVTKPFFGFEDFFFDSNVDLRMFCLINDYGFILGWWWLFFIHIWPCRLIINLRLFSFALVFESRHRWNSKLLRATSILVQRMALLKHRPFRFYKWHA